MLTRAHLDAVRRYEIARVLALVPEPRGRLLEIGAAGGFQAALLAPHFAAIEAVDLPRSIPSSATAFPVQPYDGHRLPFPDGSFDMVFSSNVLEHIAHVEAFQAEIRRVLKRGGRAVHVLPTASWRMWTILAHYLELPLRLAARLRPTPAQSPGAFGAEAQQPAGHRSRFPSLGALVERRHGERGCTVSELYLFSRPAWTALFRRNRFAVEMVEPLGLFYTGYALLGEGLGLPARRKLARVFGSATMLYVLRDAS
jgi:SAM-dependent methyltransferase